jgi:hypothetical protein
MPWGRNLAAGELSMDPRTQVLRESRTSLHRLRERASCALESFRRSDGLTDRAASDCRPR